MTIHNILRFLVISLSLFMSQLLLASQEQVLPVSEFYMKSKGVGESGEVLINGKIDNQGRFVSLSVNAFGTIYLIHPWLMQRISLPYQNAVELSYEERSREHGGRTIFLRFQSGLSRSSNKHIKISISENGAMHLVEY